MIFPLQALLQLVLQEFQQGLGWMGNTGKVWERMGGTGRIGGGWVGLGGFRMDGWDREDSGERMGRTGRVQCGWVG